MRLFTPCFVALCTIGCSQMGPLKELPDSDHPANSAILNEALSYGATTCRYNLELMLIHAFGTRNAIGSIFYPGEFTATRPTTGLYVTEYPNGDKSHLQWIVGPDKSGNCTVSFSETRYWKYSCARVIDGHARYAHAHRQEADNQIYLTDVTRKNDSLRVILTPLGKRSCLATESDTVWRVEPDSEAKQWIKEDLGYDPDSINK